MQEYSVEVKKTVRSIVFTVEMRNNGEDGIWEIFGFFGFRRRYVFYGFK